MWEKRFLLLLHAVEAAVASQCWQGATFSEAVVSPAVESSGILRVPGVTSLPQCVAACCDLPGYDLAWLFEGRCYILSCQQRENCRPRERPGADSFLAFLRRPSPQTLVLQSLVRGAPYNGHWRPLSMSSEAPGDLEALKDLALFDEPRQDFSTPAILDPSEYSDGSQEETINGGLDVEVMRDQLPLKGTDGFNQSESDDGPKRGPTESSLAQIRAPPLENISQVEENRTRRPDLSSAAKETITKSSNDSASPTPTAESTQQDHLRTSVPTSAAPPSSTTVQPDTRDPLQPAGGAPPTTTQPTAWTVPSDHTPSSAPSTKSPSSTTTTPSATTASQDRESNRGPLAVVGPDTTLFLPVTTLLLNGSGSIDDRGIISYHWDAVSGPPGFKLEGVDQAVATVSGLHLGRYTFRLTVSDQQGATDSASLTVRVQEARSLPPVAHASGSHTLTLPNNSLVLRGSITDGDQTEVHYLWTRDSQSPAAGDVLYGSDTQASLYLANLVEGTYLFQLRVTDAQGHSSTATATVEVRPEPGGGEEVELEMLVSVSQVSMAQRDTVVRQLAALLHILDRDIQVRALQGHSRLRYRLVY
ncbi:Dyslexia-associated protein KIAA0319 Precursor [Channa argus]|uniref:Dyslexia-associated protein KIAA0319 n=1 Tax=Channa argus TaxID=215402 RepID=A0A6G1PQ91_CHAAH|nr:Dyslexia-associated protein KIAA0319 Precursor [Channa argus]